MRLGTTIALGLLAATAAAQAPARQFERCSGCHGMPDPASEDGRAQIQTTVDDMAQVFVESVARNRGVPVAQVLRDFGQGDVLVGQRALDAGLVDELGTLDDLISAAEVQPTGGLMASIEIAKITAQWLAENVPGIAAEIRSAAEKSGRDAGYADGHKTGKEEGVKVGAEKERARILGIEANALPGHEDLVAKAKADPTQTPESTAVAILQAEKAAQAAALAGLKHHEKKNPAPAPSTNTTTLSDDDEAKAMVDRARKMGVVA